MNIFSYMAGPDKIKVEKVQGGGVIFFATGPRGGKYQMIIPAQVESALLAFLAGKPESLPDPFTARIVGRIGAGFYAEDSATGQPIAGDIESRFRSIPEAKAEAVAKGYSFPVERC